MTTLLTTLPRELLIELFEALDADSSTCLGLTCKKLYNIHQYTQQRLNRNLLYERPGPFQPSSQLPDLLATWMGPSLVHGYPYTHNFVTEERLGELKKEWIPWLMAWKNFRQDDLWLHHVYFPLLGLDDNVFIFEFVCPGNMSTVWANTSGIPMELIAEVEDLADSVWRM
jgi:hypothetical protein